MRRGAVLMVGVLGACAAAPPSVASPLSDDVADEWVRRRARASGPTVRVAAAVHRARVSERIAVGLPGSARIDVAFRGAPLAEALRLLAGQARLQLVIADELPGEVNLRLRDVRPYDALLALAEAHGADVLRDGDLVIVRAR